MTKVKVAAARAQLWLEREALPLWGSAGVDDDGSFHERLWFDGRPDVASSRRMRAQARQVYVFSEAARRGWWSGAETVARAGFEALIRNNWARGGLPGFLHTVTADKTPLDAKRDAYDHAFGLFAAGWYYKAFGEPCALTLAHEILDVLDAQLADPLYGGYLESAPPSLPRRSDPHMHLLEASLEWIEAADQPRFRALATRLVELFSSRFFDRETGTLGEYFAADLTPDDGAAGQMVAPGHHFEWCWLLAWAKRLAVGDAKAEADRLYDFGIRHGLDERLLAVDECDRQGRQIRRSRRAWPQTELIKAHITKAREGLPGAADAAAQVALDVLNSYLATSVPGLWMDQFDADGRGMSDAAPATTLYHLVVAFRELMLFAEHG